MDRECKAKADFEDIVKECTFVHPQARVYDELRSQQSLATLGLLQRICIYIYILYIYIYLYTYIHYIHNIS